MIFDCFGGVGYIPKLSKIYHIGRTINYKPTCNI